MGSTPIFKMAAVMFFLFFCIWKGSSQGFLKTNGRSIVSEAGDTVILRGMGLGGWMLQEGYMLQTSDFANAQHEIKEKIKELIGESDTEIFYDAWLQNHVRRSDIDSLAAWGFNSVRLPMHYQLFTLPVEEEPVEGQHTWIQKGFELTDSLIKWCAQNQMYVLLDLHAAPGGQGYESAISDYDPGKPSLWELKANRDKTVALWKKIAERYASESWVLGYDLLNEPNWNLSGNSLLRTLYREITDSIRKVDQNHMIFIEGNWFANDFTGLTPPWDDNMVYSPHKYWSKNQKEDIQWVLSIRDQHNVPIYFGESGENSNTWFTDAISLLEGEGIGWAWWPLKKVESISAPFSIIKTAEYDYLLNYWKGAGPKPSVAFAKATLMELAENLKTENCVFQKDVIDAMFRQVHSDQTIPYRVQSIPGVVYSTDFSLGKNGAAYYDTDVADYHVTTGSYTAWNSGWAYRNDGVDIEWSDDEVLSNGFSIGWLAKDEWMQYDVAVEETALYDIKIRYAANGSDGKFHFEHKDSWITQVKSFPNTGGWYNWQTMTVNDVVIDKEMDKLVLWVDAAGFNLGSFEFIKKSATTAIDAQYLTAYTLDSSRIELVLNKPIQDPLPASPSGFVIRVNNFPVSILSTGITDQNQRALQIEVAHVFKSSESITISYTGNQVIAEDGTHLANFNYKPVSNKIITYHDVPGKIEAEDYAYQLGTQLESTSDNGGGQNVGYIDVGDYLDYYIDVSLAGEYNLTYRVASLSSTGKVDLLDIHDNGEQTLLHSASFPQSGGWQNWRSVSKSLYLTQGKHHIRVLVTSGGFNINWYEFVWTGTSTADQSGRHAVLIMPNPTTGACQIITEEKEELESLQVFDSAGSLVFKVNSPYPGKQDLRLDLTSLPDGPYLIGVMFENQPMHYSRVIKFSK